MCKIERGYWTLKEETDSKHNLSIKKAKLPHWRSTKMVVKIITKLKCLNRIVVSISNTLDVNFWITKLQSIFPFFFFCLSSVFFQHLYFFSTVIQCNQSFFFSSFLSMPDVFQSIPLWFFFLYVNHFFLHCFLLSNKDHDKPFLMFSGSFFFPL